MLSLRLSLREMEYLDPVNSSRASTHVIEIVLSQFYGRSRISLVPVLVSPSLEGSLYFGDAPLAVAERRQSRAERRRSRYLES